MSQRKGPKRWTGSAFAVRRREMVLLDMLTATPKPPYCQDFAGVVEGTWQRVRVTITPLRPRRPAAKEKR